MKLNIKKHLPAILTGLGVVGSAAVGVSAGIAQHKVEEALHELKIQKVSSMTRAELEDHINEDKPYFTNQEIVKAYAKNYLPTAIIFALTSGCIISGHKMSQKQYKQLLGAYAGLGAGFAGYRGAVIDKYGEEADEELCEKASMAVMTDPCCVDLVEMDTPDEPLLYYEPISKTYFRAYERDVILAEYHLNRNFLLRGEVNVSELLYFLGIEPTAESDKYGWNMTCGVAWIDMYHWQHKRPGKETYYELVYLFGPEEDYRNVDYDPEYQELSYVRNV